MTLKAFQRTNDQEGKMDFELREPTIISVNDHAWLLNDHDEATGYVIAGAKRAAVIDTMIGLGMTSPILIKERWMIRMNIWDLVVITVIIGAAAVALRSIHHRRKSGCGGCCTTCARVCGQPEKKGEGRLISRGKSGQEKGNKEYDTEGIKTRRVRPD